MRVKKYLCTVNFVNPGHWSSDIRCRII